MLTFHGILIENPTVGQRVVAALGRWAHAVASAALACCVLGMAAFGQTHLGQHFWVVDPYTFSSMFTITVANPGTVAAQISIYNVIEGTTNATVPAGGVQHFTFWDHEVSDPGDTISSDPVYSVTSDQDVAVFASDPLANCANNESTLVLPSHAFGNVYRVAHYAPFHEPQILVVATQPGFTNVLLIDTNEVVVSSASLPQGTCLVRRVLSDMTGWKVVADQRVAAFTAQSEAMINSGFEDPLFEQLLPESMLSHVYAVAPLRIGPNGCSNSSDCAADVFRIVAHANNTVITTTPNVGGGTLNEGDTLQFSTATDFIIQGTKPFAAFQYLSSAETAFAPNPKPLTGDPAMVSLLSIDHFTKDYLVFGHSSFPNHQLSVIAPLGVSLELDGNPINPTWNLIGTIGSTQFGSMRIPVSAGSHRLTSTNFDFGLMVVNWDYSGSELHLGGFGTPTDGAWIRDTDDDIGLEPNPSSNWIWDSPDIWVRNFQDSSLQFEHQHQNPIPSITNYVYVKVRNLSSSAISGGTLVTYFSQASTGQNWSSSWIGNPLTGDTIGSQAVPLIPVGGEVVLEFPWVPASAAPNGILARYVSSSDPMAFPEVTSVLANAKNNNNIAMKNVVVVALPTAVSNQWDIDLPVHIVNAVPFYETFEVTFGSVGPIRTAFAFQGTVRVTLPPDLYLAWELAGGSKQGFELEPGTTTFRMTSQVARLSGLPLAPMVEHTLGVRFTLPPSRRIAQPAPAPLYMRQQATSSGSPASGFTFEFTRPTLLGIKR